ncbi:hypothetical protein SLA_2454 [Streptomyces laurentii]|uniref:Uncharacterized protein n=1 Tax=Streptomyces laurentii TaxID=39478 RepID=A0A160NZE1_STRLU|nr:hypothetical protein SLA_2454 [Streptomyces laurentii]
MRTTRAFLAPLPLIAAIAALGAGPVARAVAAEDCGGGTEIMSDEEYDLRYGTGPVLAPPAPFLP